MKKLLKVLVITIGSLMYLSSFLIMNSVSLFLCFIDTRDLILIQVFLLSFSVFIKKLSEIFFFCPFEEYGQEISLGLVITTIKLFKLLVFTFTNFEYTLFFFLIEFCKPCVIHGLVTNSSSFLLSFLSGAYVSNRPSILDRDIDSLKS